MVEETRKLTVHFTDPDAHLLADFATTLKAVGGDVQLRGDPEHAGIQYRPSNEVAENKSARYTFHAEGIDPRKDKDLPWVALTYELGDKMYTVQHMRHPTYPPDSGVLGLPRLRTFWQLLRPHDPRGRIGHAALSIPHHARRGAQPRDTGCAICQVRVRQRTAAELTMPRLVERGSASLSYQGSGPPVPHDRCWSRYHQFWSPESHHAGFPRRLGVSDICTFGAVTNFGVLPTHARKRSSPVGHDCALNLMTGAT